jgi:hypothetical protein
MREAGVRVLTVREVLAYGAREHVGARVELEEFAMQVRAARVEHTHTHTHTHTHAGLPGFRALVRI